ncbi:MAG TPA: TorF family putative porin [Gammaproteobacteria bacterium]|nr:TorF family putative porin [Gammaproteobacteria bacterium]HRP86809.1 TorF family putative porin [Gammaproteobacteria bacterium]
MTKYNSRTPLLAAALAGGMMLAAPAAVHAEDGWWIGGSLTATSDYVFRGVSQTDEGPAVQAGLDIGYGAGFYAGIWASNVDFDQPDGIDMELDFFVGYVFGLTDDATLDLSVARYTYPGSNPGFDIDYNEFTAILGFAERYSATVAYANDYVNTGESAFFYQLAADAPLGETGFNFRLAAGFNDISRAAGSDYWDYQLGINRSWGNFSADLSYFDTSGYDSDVEAFLGPGKWADGRVVLTLGVTF